MARRYDSSTTTFSPEGRLHQVEYAIEAINNAGTCIGILASDGIVLATEKRSTSSLLATPKTSDKTYPLSSHITCCVAGLTADANTLIDQARLRAGRYEYQFQHPIPVEQLVEHVCNYKHSYTQYGGLRPFGVSFLLAGWDPIHNYQLYQTDPSGNYSGWKATVIGSNNQAGKSLLKSEYGDESEGGTMPTVEEALKLAIKVLNKTMDGTLASSEKVELFVMTREEELDECVRRILSEEESQKIIQAVEREAAAEAAASSLES